MTETIEDKARRALADGWENVKNGITGDLMQAGALGADVRYAYIHSNSETARIRALEAGTKQIREWLAERDGAAKSNPQHYQRDGGPELIDLIEAYELDFKLGSVVKYVCRAGSKPGQSREDDLRKAHDYLHRARTGRWPWETEGTEK